jgi:NAD(P)H-dependent FMN reductase
VCTLLSANWRTAERRVAINLNGVAVLNLLVVVASTRPTRIGGGVASWVENQAKAHGGFEVTTADLAALDLPLMNEPEHPRLRSYRHEHTVAWSETVERSDCAVFVMPEYNSSFTAPLKNALDYLVQEWAYLPVGLFSYGGVNGGSRAVQALRPVLTNLSAVPTGSPVNVHHVANHISDGVFSPSQGVAAATPRMLEELAELAGALAPLRGRALRRAG